jgi:hypothetical protein
MENSKIIAREAINEPKRKRRKRGQAGSCFRRGSSYTIIYRAPNGKQKWESGFRTKEAARARLNEALGEIRKGKYVESTDLLFGEFCDTWMENAKGSLKPTTWVYYRSVLKKWIRPTLGERPICEISRGEVKDFILLA